MSPTPEDQWRPPEPPPRPPRQGGAAKPPARPKWMPWVIIALIVAIFLVWQTAQNTSPARASIPYGKFLDLVKDNQVQAIKYESSSGKITGKFAQGHTEDGKAEFTTQGQVGGIPDPDLNTLAAHNVSRDQRRP